MKASRGKPSNPYFRASILLLALTTGCVGSGANTTFIYAIDSPINPQIDRNTCATGIGLRNLDLGLQDAIAYTLDETGRNAFLTTCAISGNVVTGCGFILPEVELFRDGDRITGEAIARLSIDGECEGADLPLRYDLLLEGDQLTAHADATWNLDATAACEQLESSVIANDPQELGITGCVVNFDFTAQKVAECNFTRSSNCVIE